MARLAPTRPVVVDVPRALRTERLMLRPLEVGDRDPYVRAAELTRADLERWMPLHREGESDEQMFERQLALSNSASAAPEFVRLVGVTGDGLLVGGFNLNAISRGLEWRADIAWWGAADCRGRGFAAEAVGALLDYALSDVPAGLGLHVVSAWITPDNAASLRLAERVGLRRDGELRSYLQTGERWAVHECYSRGAGE